jgi:hypothetical protein
MVRSPNLTLFEFFHDHATLRARRLPNGTHVSRVLAEPTRSASRPTRSSRLGGASPISFSFYSDSGRTLELGRSDGTLARGAFLLFIHCLARTRAAPA